MLRDNHFAWNAWSIYWIVVWFLGGFGIAESYCLITGHPENTLSDQVWHLEGNFGPPWTWNFMHILLAAGFIWLAGHMIWRIWR